MKSYLFMPVMALLAIGCTRKTTCTDEMIRLKYQLKSKTDVLHFKFSTYKKGSNFSELISTEADSARMDTLTPPYSTYSNHNSLNAANDYIIEITETGKTYKVSDINYDGDKKKDDNVKSESRIRCTRTTYYTLNGEVKKQEGSTYDKGFGGPTYATITISR